MIPFDDVIAIDWSGSQARLSPGITVAKASIHQSCVSLITPPQKYWSRTHVAEWLLSQATSSKRLLVGIDSNFGYAASIIQKRIPHLQSAPELWSMIDHVCCEDLDFYAPSFWKDSILSDAFWVTGKKPLHFEQARRQTELSCITQQLGSPESPLKLLGAKQVGKGGLAAMRMAHFLKQKLQEKIAFWPFDTQERYDQATIVIAEIYPRLFLKKAHHGLSKVRDVKKLRELFSFFQATPPELSSVNDHQADALIAAAGMRHLIHENTDLLNLEDCSALFLKKLRIEGWILGAPFPREEK